MQKTYSFVLHIAGCNMDLPYESFDVTPENALGAYFISEATHRKKLTLSVVRANKMFQFNVTNTIAEIEKIKYLYNFSASLSKCSYSHIFKYGKNGKLSSLEIQITAYDDKTIEYLDVASNIFKDSKK